MNINEIKSILRKGLIQIFSANVINKVVQFFTVTILLNIISRTEYGLFAYGKNILDIILLMEGLGVTTGILQYCSSNRDIEEKQGIFKFGLSVGIAVNLVLSILTLLYGCFGVLPSGKEGSRIYIMLLSGIPMLTVVFNSIQSYLRSTLRNSEFSILTTFNTVLYLIFTCTFAYFMKAEGLILGMYLAYFCTIVLGTWFIRKDIFSKKKGDIPNFSKSRFMKYSIVTVMTNAMSQLLFLIDTQLIGIFIPDPGVLASYKTATMIPFNLTFIPASIMVFVYPYFVQHKEDKKWVRDKTTKIVKSLFVVNIIIATVGILFSDIILGIFGQQYLDAKPCYIILMIGYVVAGTLRTPLGNIIASQGDARLNFINAVFSGVANVILDILFILKFGSIGAAYATVSIYIISSGISIMFIRKITAQHHREV